MAKQWNPITKRWDQPVWSYREQMRQEKEVEIQLERYAKQMQQMDKLGGFFLLIMIGLIIYQLFH